MQKARISCKRKWWRRQPTGQSHEIMFTRGWYRQYGKKWYKLDESFCARRSKYPIASRDLIKLLIAVDALNRVATRNERYVLVYDFPSHLVGLILTYDSNLQILCRSDAELFANRILKCCVNLFAQLYVIQARVNGYYMPLVFCLLIGKTEGMYKLIWKFLRDRGAILGLVFLTSVCQFLLWNSCSQCFATSFSVNINFCLSISMDRH